MVLRKTPRFILCFSFFLFFTAGCAAAESPDSAAGCSSDDWTLLRSMRFGQSTLSVMFGDENFGVAGDLSGKIYYTEDGGTTWTGTIKAGPSRAALEILEGNTGIWYLGVGGDLEHSVDRGRTWKSAGPFPWTRHVEYISFSDKLNGWGMTTEQSDFYTTADGGKTWKTIPLPEGMAAPAALHLRTPSDGYILDTAGHLFISADGGTSWEIRSLGLGDGETIPTLNHSAAIRFSDALHGVAALTTIRGGSGRTRALRTSDGGATWTEEILAVPMGMFHLSRDGIYLTHVDLNDHGKITLLCSARARNP
ncbi:MAG: hypothetical protein WBM17_14235 [Anaerolineales bacterium]